MRKPIQARLNTRSLAVIYNWFKSRGTAPVSKSGLVSMAINTLAASLIQGGCPAVESDQEADIILASITSIEPVVIPAIDSSAYSDALTMLGESDE